MSNETLPIAAPKKKFDKTATHHGTVGEVIDDAYNAIQELGGEFREIVDNASENLQNTDLNQTRAATADACESLDQPEARSTILSELDVTYVEDLGKVYRGRQQQSRACRANNIAGMFRAAADAVSEWISNNPDDVPEYDEDKSEDEQSDEYKAWLAKGFDKDDYEVAREEADDLADSLNSVADEIEGMEWPGMFG
jgi:hypothetical protein